MFAVFPLIPLQDAYCTGRSSPVLNAIIVVREKDPPEVFFASIMDWISLRDSFEAAMKRVGEKLSFVQEMTERKTWRRKGRRWPSGRG
jgi:hypothetical protein